MILHLCTLDKFIPPFILFVKENFEDFGSRQLFYISGSNPLFECPDEPNVFSAGSLSRFSRMRWLVIHANRAEKIILHGLWDPRVVQVLAAQPWLLKKCYWVIWGGDLYTYKLSKRTLGWWKSEIFRRFVIKRFGHFVTHVKGDFELACRWYGASGQWHECFLYPSNIAPSPRFVSTNDRSVNVLVGNSADPSNNHFEILDRLATLSEPRLRIFCPLSYGIEDHVNAVLTHGKSLFGASFVPLQRFMPENQYVEMLSMMNFAIFNHNRQQAMGNIVQLLGMGKTVYLRSDTTTWGMLRHIGVTVKDVSDLDLSPLPRDLADRNSSLIANYFSHGNLAAQWGQIFGG